tara:strand:+ start:650 stop:3613 length:2964 start_codon:yes stop_codon:yes gene_type:complete
MVSFMSGLPRVRPNMGKVKRASFVTGFVDRHFKNKAEKIRKQEADRKFEQDQELVDIRRSEADNRKKEFDLKLKTDKTNQNIAEKQLRQEAGYVALPGFKYLNEDGEMTDFEYIKGDEDSAQNSLEIIKQVENFLDPQSINAKNIQQAISENGSPFEDLVIKHMDNLSRMQQYKIDDKVLGSKTLMPLVMPLEPNGVTNIDQYTNLMNTFKMLKSKNMPFLDYAKDLQNTSLTAAGYNLKDLENNPIYYSLDENNNLIVYNKDPAAVEGFKVDPSNVSVAENMFTTATSPNENNFKKQLYILKASEIIDTDQNTVTIASSLIDPEVNKAIGFSKVNHNSSATGSEMINLVKATSSMAVQLNPDENFAGIRSVKNTRLKVNGVVAAHFVQNSGKYFNLRKDRGETIITLNPQYANNIINLQDSSNTKIKQENASFLRIGKEGVSIINDIFRADDDIKKLGGEAFRLSTAVTGPIFDTVSITKKVLSNITGVISNLGLSKANTDYFTQELNNIDALQNAAYYGDEALLKAGTTGLGAANNAQAKENVDLAYTSYNQEMTNLNTQFKNGDVTEEIYAARARAEGLKVRLAFKLASLVQGGGTGGRTISNQDYEVIVKSLYGKTNRSFRENLNIVRHTLFKSQVGAEIFKRFAGTGTQDEMINLAESYIDADFNARSGTNFNSNSYSSIQNFDKSAEGNITKNLKARSNISVGTNTYNEIAKFESDYGIDSNLVDIFQTVVPSQSLDVDGSVFRSRANAFQGLVKGILIPSIIKDRQKQNFPFTINNIQNDITKITGNEQLANKLASDFFQQFPKVDFNEQNLNAIINTTVNALPNLITEDTQIKGKVLNSINSYNMKQEGITQISGLTLPPIFQVTEKEFGQKGNPRIERVIKINMNDKVKQQLNEFVNSIPEAYDKYTQQWNENISKGIRTPKMSFPEYRNKKVASQYGIPNYAYKRSNQRANLKEREKLGAEALDALLQSIDIDPYRE